MLICSVYLLSDSKCRIVSVKTVRAGLGLPRTVRYDSLWTEVGDQVKTNVYHPLLFMYLTSCL